MPEGHTLHRLANEQNERFAGTALHVSSPQGRFTEGAAIVDGHVLEEVSATGKHLFAAFDIGVVHVHLGLYGKFTSGATPAPERWGALRMRWVNDDWWTDLRGATTCEVIDEGQVAAIHARLGPDPIAPGADGEKAWARVARSRAPIAVLLMDQRVVAGIGNVYRAEVLFRHRISPFAEGRSLTAEQWSVLWRDIVTLMRAGVRSGQIVTTRPEDRRRGRVRAIDVHYVYRRAGMPCRVCGTPVASRELAGRNLFWCPSCQSG